MSTPPPSATPEPTAPGDTPTTAGADATGGPAPTSSVAVAEPESGAVAVLETADAPPAEAASAEAPPAEAPPAETASVEAAPAEAASVEAAPAEAGPTTADGATPADTESDAATTTAGTDTDAEPARGRRRTGRRGQAAATTADGTAPSTADGSAAATDTQPAGPTDRDAAGPTDAEPTRGRRWGARRRRAATTADGVAPVTAATTADGSATTTADTPDGPEGTGATATAGTRTATRPADAADADAAGLLGDTVTDAEPARSRPWAAVRRRAAAVTRPRGGNVFNLPGVGDDTPDNGQLVGICAWATGLGVVGLLVALRGMVAIVSGHAPNWYEPALISVGLAGIVLTVLAFLTIQRTYLPWIMLALATVPLGVNIGLTVAAL